MLEYLQKRTFLAWYVASFAPHFWHLRQSQKSAIDLAIKQNRRISVLELSSNVGISVGSIDTIIHEHILYSNVSARWVPKMSLETSRLAVQRNSIAAWLCTGSQCKCDAINYYQTGLGSVDTSSLQPRFGPKQLSLVRTSQWSLGWNKVWHWQICQKCGAKLATYHARNLLVCRYSSTSNAVEKVHWCPG